MLRIIDSPDGLGIAGSTWRIQDARAGRPVVDPLAAFVAACRAAAPNASGMYPADPPYYTASLSQAGVFTDAFGGPITYTAPYIMASPTAVQDPASGLWYVSADGATNTATGNAPETIRAYTALWRSPVTPFANYGALIDTTANGATRLGDFQRGGTGYASDCAPRALRRNGVAITPTQGSLSPITDWQITTSYCQAGSDFAQIMGLFQVWGSYYNRLHLAALCKWSVDPSASEVQALEGVFAQRYAKLLNP